MKLCLHLGLLASTTLAFPGLASAAPEDDALETTSSDDAREDDSLDASATSDSADDEPATTDGSSGAAASSASVASSGRPWSLQIGLGPMANLEGAGVLGKLPIDFQYHFMGGDTGPALGGQLVMNFATAIFGMEIGPIFLWDFRVYQTGKFKLYAAPLVALGYTFMRIVPLDVTGHGFFMDFGGQLKGLFNDRVGFYVRPVNFSLAAGSGGATGYYSFLAGVSLAF